VFPDQQKKTVTASAGLPSEVVTVPFIMTFWEKAIPVNNSKAVRKNNLINQSLFN